MFELIYKLPFFTRVGRGKSVHNPTVLTLSTKVPRIKSGTSHYGRGDDGYSEFVEGLRLPKHSPAHQIYGEVERTKWALSKVLYLNKQVPFLEPFDAYQLEWFCENLHSLGSYCFSWGKDTSTNHIYPVEVLSTIEKRIKYIQNIEIDNKIIGHCQDFLSFDDERLLELDFARMCFRKLESNYFLWYTTIYGLVPIEGTKKDTLALLNRASIYIWWVMRHTSRILKIQEIYWAAKVTPYNPPSFEIEE